MNIVLLGAPGSGKGTLATKLKERYKIPHISSGDIIRAEVANKTAFGQQVADIIAKGQLLPDTSEFMGKLFSAVRARLSQKDCRFGFILDGIPRRDRQVEDLSQNLAMLGKAVDAIILLEASYETLLARLTGRIICQKCSLSYHRIFKKPSQDGICNSCKGPLISRQDDSEKTALDRLEIYRKEIPGIIDLYKNSNLIRINAELSENTVFTEATKQLFPRHYLKSKIEFRNHKGVDIYNLVEIYKDPVITNHIIEEFASRINEVNCDYLAAPEARALPIFGGLIGKTALPGIFVRKSGKLPPGLPVFKSTYKTAHSDETHAIEMYADPHLNGSKVIVIDDGISTGSTTLAVIELLEQARMEVVGILAPVRYHYAKNKPALTKWEKYITTLFDLG